MRRKDREVTNSAEIEHILNTAKVMHFGLTDHGMPYVVPLNYGYSHTDNKLVFYAHSAKEGRKLELIRKDPRCCVQLDCDGMLQEGEKACDYGYCFYSLIGFGKVSIVDDICEKRDALSLLMKTQTGKDFCFTDAMADTVAVLRIECERFRAKHRPMPR